MNPSAPVASPGATAPGGAPAWGSNPFSTGNLAQSVGEIAPLATEYHGVQNGVAINQVSNATARGGGVVATFAHWLGGAASQTGHVAGDVAKWLGQQTVSMATAPIRYAESEGQGILDNVNLAAIQAENKQQSSRMDTLNSQYKTGRINKQQYTSALDSLMQDQRNTASREDALLHRLPQDQHQAVQATIDTASTLVTILTAGFGKAYATGISAKGLEPLAAKSTADYLASSAADPFFGPVERSVAQLAANPGALGKLGGTAQKFVQFAAAEVVSQGGEMSAGQIARATAVNLAFKYPLYYQMMSSTGAQIYSELDQKKYGDAVRTMAFNAALMLSGGPIGWALNKMSMGATILKTSMFGQTSFWDEISKATGNGDPAGIFNAVNKISDPVVKKDVIQQLSAVEATNLHAVGGDARAAAWRVVKGMAGYEGVSLNNFTHEELLNNMVTFAKAQRMVDSYSKQLGKAVTVGRVDARALDTIATGLTKSDLEAANADEVLNSIPPTQPQEVDMSKAPDFLQPTEKPTESPDITHNKEAGFVMIPGAKGQPIRNMTSALDAQAYKDFESFYKDYKPFFDDQGMDEASARRIYQISIQSPITPIGTRGARVSSSIQTQFEQAYNTGDMEKARTFAQQIEDPTSRSVALQAVDRSNATRTITSTNPTVQKMIEEAQARKAAKATADLTRNPQAGFVAIGGSEEASQRGQAVLRRLQAWKDLKMQNPNQAWANNENFDRQIKTLIQKFANDPTGLEDSVRKITASFEVPGLPKTVSRQLAKMGYIAIKPVNLEAPFREGTGKIATQFASKTDDFFMKSVPPLPVLGFLGDTLTRFGLSPNSANTQVYQAFNNNVASNLQELGVLGKVVGDKPQQESDLIMKQLSNYARSPVAAKAAAGMASHSPSAILDVMPVTDFRMLSVKDIAVATNRNMVDARAIQKAIGQAYIQVPLTLRGLGDRAVDYLYAGPQSALARKYFRIQGALRFSWNPFFEYMRVIPKTEILTESEGGGVLQSIFTGRYGQLNEVRSMLRGAGMFDEAGHIGTVMGAEAADTDVIYASRNISKHLLPMQERSIAGLINSQADRMGMTVEDYIKAYPQQARDTVQAIAQYSRNYNFLNSPMARTLNVAIFPFRFEAKVAGFMAKALARQPLMTQVAVIHGLMQAHAWLNSPEGIAWYSRNSTAIQLFDYITPLAEMNKVFESLLPGHDHALGNFGELGGLPFGWIPQLTDAEGWTHFNQPGVDAATGQVIPRYMPATDRGQVAIAVQDLIGSLFSYPGSTAGLPSKASITRNIALGVTMGTKSADLKLSTPPVSDLSRQQQSYSQAVQALNANQIPSGQTTPQRPGLIPSQTVPGLQVPQMDSSLLHPTLTAKQQGLSSTRSKKLKKGQYIPALLPGQTQLGVLG